MTTTITPIVEELSEYFALSLVTHAYYSLAYITSENCTVEILTPIVEELKVVITTAITEVKGLTGFTLTTVLTTVDGVVLTIAEVAELLCELLTVSVDLVLLSGRSSMRIYS